MAVTLEVDGIAVVELASWPPGQSDQPDVETHAGKWTFDSNVLQLTLDEGEILLDYDAQLSFIDFGIYGSAPGFRTIVSSFHPDLFNCRGFWLHSEIEKIDWPEYPYENCKWFGPFEVCGTASEGTAPVNN